MSSDLDAILDTYERRRGRVDSTGLLKPVSVKIPESVRDEFYAAAETLGVPRRELAAALFMHGMERLRKQTQGSKPSRAFPKSEAQPPTPQIRDQQSPPTTRTP